MRRIIFAFILTIAAPFVCFAQGITANSQINQVVVFSEDALVNRVANVKLNAGEEKIIFPGIIPEIDEDSLRVSGSGSAEVKILGAQVLKEFVKETPVQRVQELKDQIEQLNDQIRKLNDTKMILLDEKAYLDSIRLFSNGQIPKDLVTKMPPAKDLEDTLKFLDAKLKDNFMQIAESDINIRETQKKIVALNNELNSIAGPEKNIKRSIVVDVEVVKPGSLDLNVSYKVEGAWWYPLYDARVNFAKQSTDFVSYGVVKQTTGEDWQDAEISLSTARVNVSGSMPEVEPWFVRPYEERMLMQEAKTRMHRSKMEGALEDMSFAGSPNAQAEKAKEFETQDKYAKAEERGVSVVYKIARKATVKSDGAEHKLPVSSQELKSAFEYSAYPRLSTFAYLRSKVTNAKDLQLLGGRVNVFLDGDFVGRSDINNVGPQEEFDLYLGVDENVKVKREEVEKKVDDILFGGIPSPNKKTTYKYKITVENYKSKKINVNLFEAIPVSQNEKIRVNILNTSLAPKDKDWKDRKGIWRWEFELEPKAKQEIIYSYTVEHPRDMRVEGL